VQKRRASKNNIEKALRKKEKRDKSLEEAGMVTNLYRKVDRERCCMRI